MAAKGFISSNFQRSVTFDSISLLSITILFKTLTYDHMQSVLVDRESLNLSLDRNFRFSTFNLTL